MKIPENFKQKYSLTGESYSPKNVDAALSELFSVSGRLYKENSDLKAEIARLREEADASKTSDALDISGLELTVSGLELMITALESKIDAIRTAVNDTLCVANDAAISAKKAEDSAAEAKLAADAAKTAAEESRDASEDALDAAEAAVSAVKEVKDVAESVQVAVEAIGDKLDNVNADVIPMIFDEEPAAEEIPEEIVEEISEECEANIPEDDGEITEEEVDDLLADVAMLEGFEDEPEEAVVPEETTAPVEFEIIEPAPEVEEIEIIEESETAPVPKEEPAPEKPSSFADELIRFAGLDSEPEQIEPAEDVHEDDITSKLAEMYGSDEEPEEKPEAPAEEEKPAEEKHAPTSFNDMKSALDAIRARLKK